MWRPSFFLVSGCLSSSDCFPPTKHLSLLLLLALHLHFKTLSSTVFSEKKGLRLSIFSSSNPDIGLCTERSIECLYFLSDGITAVCRCRLTRSPRDPLLDFCKITKAFLCWICLGVTHHTYLSTACVHPGSCLILNALHQKHSSPVKQYTCTPRYTSLILFYPRCPIYIPSTARLLRMENKLLEGLQPGIIQVFLLAKIKTRKITVKECWAVKQQVAHINILIVFVL